MCMYVCVCVCVRACVCMHVYVCVGFTPTPPPSPRGFSTCAAGLSDSAALSNCTPVDRSFTFPKGLEFEPVSEGQGETGAEREKDERGKRREGRGARIRGGSEEIA